MDSKFIEILKKASQNIKEFHSKQVRNGFKLEKEDGGRYAFRKRSGREFDRGGNGSRL